MVLTIAWVGASRAPVGLVIEVSSKALGDGFIHVHSAVPLWSDEGVADRP
jgi:hypothetical protein